MSTTEAQARLTIHTDYASMPSTVAEAAETPCLDAIGVMLVRTRGSRCYTCWGYNAGVWSRAAEQWDGPNTVGGK